MKTVILCLICTFCGTLNAQVPFADSYMTYGRSGNLGYGLNTSGSGQYVGAMFNPLSGADKWSLGYASTPKSVGTSILTWTTSKVGVLNTSPAYALDVTGYINATSGVLSPTFTATGLISGSYISATNGISAVTVTASGLGTFGTLTTGIGATELYLMDQNVRTSDSPSFSGARFTGPAALASASLAALAGTTPTYIGQVWSCYNCVPPKIAFATGTIMGQIGNALGELLQ